MERKPFVVFYDSDFNSIEPYARGIAVLVANEKVNKYGQRIVGMCEDDVMTWPEELIGCDHEALVIAPRPIELDIYNSGLKDCCTKILAVQVYFGYNFCPECGEDLRKVEGD